MPRKKSSRVGYINVYINKGQIVKLLTKAKELIL